MLEQGVSEEKAKSRIYMMDSKGLVVKVHTSIIFVYFNVILAWVLTDENVIRNSSN